MGTPEYARVILEGLMDTGALIRVVTRPDSRTGRKQFWTASRVGAFAMARGLVVDKPYRLKDFRAIWQAFEPDLIVTAAYGRILPAWALDLPKKGAFNLHASLLPRWRGANPIAWAIRAGDSVSGVTLMGMDQGMDTGPIVATQSMAIDERDTTETLTEKLARAARELLLNNWSSLIAGNVRMVPQPDQGETYAAKFALQEAKISWRESARVIDRHIRSMSPEPGAYTMANGLRLKILSARVAPGRDEPGRATLQGNAWYVGTLEDVMVIDRIQPAGRKPMSPGDFVRGLHQEAKVFLT